MEKYGKVLSQKSPLLRWKELMLSIMMLWLIPAAHAQQQPPQVIIKVNTQLVVQTVVVKDKDGKNIEGLTDKDFTVTEDGVPQAISVFHFEKLEDTPAITPVTPAAARPVNTVRPPTQAQITPSPPRRRTLQKSPPSGSVLRSDGNAAARSIARIRGGG